MADINETLNSISADDSTKGENHYGKAFRSAYAVTRKSLVALNEARKPVREGGSRKEDKDGNLKIVAGKVVSEAQLTNKEACAKLKEVLVDVMETLE